MQPRRKTITDKYQLPVTVVFLLQMVSCIRTTRNSPEIMNYLSLFAAYKFGKKSTRSAAGAPTVHAPGGRPAHAPAALQTTAMTDDDRRQPAKQYWSIRRNRQASNNVTNLRQLTSHSYDIIPPQHGYRIVTVDYCDVTPP